jgi:thiol-disulfide isomerase/thioredoxin
MTVNDQPPEAPRLTSARRLGFAAAAIAAGVLFGVAGIYGIAGLTRNAGDPACKPTFDLAGRIAPFARGEVAAVTPAARPLLLPELAFKDASGAPKKLSDWRGRTVLLNLWATWCVPCRQEMPALDKLQAELGSKDFEVVAVNIDTRNLDKPKRWLEEAGVTRLAYYADPQAKVFQDLRQIGKAVGMPTTLLLDPRGCELAHLSGPAEWASEDALTLVRAALGR